MLRIHRDVLLRYRQRIIVEQGLICLRCHLILWNLEPARSCRFRTIRPLFRGNGRNRQDLADFCIYVLFLRPNRPNRQDLADFKGARMKITRISETVQRRRKALGLTQLELADLADVSERLIRDVETGRLTIKTEKLLTILEALGLEIRIQKINSGQT